MAQDYKIVKVSEDTPREWASPHGGTIYYIRVQLEGHEKPVSIGKKAPDALKVGQTVYGTIVDSDLAEDKFKSEMSPNKPQFQPRDDAAIKAQFAIKAAIAFAEGKAEETSTIEDLAKEFFHMIDRVKES